MAKRPVFVESKERDFIGEGETSFTQVPFESRKRKISSSDSELSVESNGSKELYVNSKKKVTDAKKAAQEQAFKDIIGRMDPQTEYDDEDDVSEVEESKEDLKREIKDLQKQLLREKHLVKELQNANIMLQKSLPYLIRKTCKEAISQSFAADKEEERSASPLLGRQGSSSAASQRRGSASPSGVQPKPPFTQRPQSPLIISQCQKSPSPPQIAESPSPPQIAESPSPPHIAKSPSPYMSVQSNNGDADDHHGPSLPPLSSIADSVQVSEILNTKSERKMTMVLLGVLFERKVLVTSSVTGKSKEGRPALDPEKVQLIISHVSKRFPDSTPSSVRAAMAQKCKDERNAVESRRLKAERV